MPLKAGRRGLNKKYLDRMGNPNYGSSIEIESLSVTENGTYTAQENKAYTPVSVNVPQTTIESLSVTENGTYTAASGKAFSPVTVNVPTGAPVTQFVTNQTELIGKYASGDFSIALANFSTTSSIESHMSDTLGYNFEKISMSDYISILKSKLFYCGEIYNDITDAIAAGISAELIGDFSSGGQTTGNVLTHPITDYELILLQGVYRQGYRVDPQYSYNDTMVYYDVALNTPYWCGMKDRNSSFTCNVTFTDATHCNLSDVKRCAIYGIK